jgi:hypothetical protein
MSDSQTRPAPDFTTVRAIALDTNIFSEAPGITTLATLCSRADKHGRVEIWVSDTVIWEWGQHLHVHHLKLRAAARKLHSAGLLVEVPDAQTAQDVAENLAKTIGSLGTSIRILSTADFAHEALRDQILLEGPAKRKSEVKTGAADSAHLRAYIHEGKSRDLDYVVVSGDKDTRNAYEQWLGHDSPTIFNDLNKAAEKIFGSVPSDADGIRLALRIAYQCEVLLQDVTVNEGRLGSWEDLVPNEFASLSFDVDAASASLVGLDHAKQDSTALTFTAFYLADVKVGGLMDSPWNLGGSQARQEAVLPKALLRVDVSVPAGSDSAEDASTTHCYLHAGEGGGWLEQRDVLDGVMEALTLVPSITTQLDGLASWPEQDRTQHSNLTIDVSGEPLELDLYGSYYGNWEIEASYRGQTVVLRCQELGVGYFDSEGDGIPEYYDLVAVGREEWSGNAEFAINELLLQSGVPELPDQEKDEDEGNPSSDQVS